MGDSPVKKANFDSANKENAPIPTPIVDSTEKPKAVEPPVAEQESQNVAPGIKDTEADEPLLRENPHRFVMFPIQYHEVSNTPVITTRHALRSFLTR